MFIILKNTPDWQSYFSLWHKILEVVPRRCPFCDREHALIGHGRRRRQVLGLGRKRYILVQRMRCKYCGKTITVRPEFIARRYRIAKPVIAKVKELRKSGAKWTWIPLELKRIFRCKLFAVGTVYRLGLAKI